MVGRMRSQVLRGAIWQRPFCLQAGALRISQPAVRQETGPPIGARYADWPPKQPKSCNKSCPAASYMMGALCLVCSL
jgi:hypothetical protein